MSKSERQDLDAGSMPRLLTMILLHSLPTNIMMDRGTEV